MTRTSSGSRKNGPPAYSNTYAYKQTHLSTEAKSLLATPISAVCPSCRAVLEWRKRFNKYKMLTVPKKCVRCGEKAIREPYHVICQPCIKGVCAKCLTPKAAWTAAAEVNDSGDVDTN